MTSDIPGMSTEPDAYLRAVEKLEPDIHPIDASAFYASAAISLKRIADSLEMLGRLAALIQMEGVANDRRPD